MSYETIAAPGGDIRIFTPDDTFNRSYLLFEGEIYSFSEIKEMAKKKWPGIREDEIEMFSEHIKTRYYEICGYDSEDWTHYIILQASKKYFKRI